MKISYKTYVVEMSLYYGLLALMLPLIYAVTNQLVLMSVFSMEWLCVTVFLYPIVLLLSAVRYSFQRMKKASHL